MAHFYGTLRGSAGETSRTGTKSSGLTTYTASWNGAVRSHVYYNDEYKQDWVIVELVEWQGIGTYKLLYHGSIKGEHDGN